MEDLLRFSRLQPVQWTPRLLPMDPLPDLQLCRAELPGAVWWDEALKQVYATLLNAMIADSLHSFIFPGALVADSSAAPGNPENHTVLQYLLGSRHFSGSGVPLFTGSVNYLGTNAAAKGNGFFAGFTLGPQYLEDENGAIAVGLTDVLQQDQKIQFQGRDQPDIFPTDSYTKYVLRPGGVTGVFNLDLTADEKLISIYGYDLLMHKFAFRQVVNRIDKKTLINGKVDLPYPAEVRVYFTDLDLSCTGNFGQGLVDSEKCDELDNDNDTIVDEGCNQSYSYWNIPVEYLGIGFEPSSPGAVCDANRQLRLRVSQKFERLSRRLNHSAFWSPAGIPSAESMGGPTDLVLDPLNGGNGFPIQLRSGYLNQPTSYSGSDPGFVNLVSKVGLPLFDSPILHSHLRNNDDSNSGVIAMFRDETSLDSDHNGVPDYAYGSVTDFRTLAMRTDETLTEDPRPRAVYHWPTTDLLTLDYPMTYSAATVETLPRFNGVSEDTSFMDLANPVATVKTVPDFLEPGKARFVMGAGAEYPEIKDLTFDLAAPSAVNSFLSTVMPGTSIQIENYLGGLSTASLLMDQASGGDLTKDFRPLLDTQLQQPLVGNPLIMAAENLAVLRTAPRALASLLTSRIDTLRSQVVEMTAATSTAPLNSEVFNDLYMNYAACALFAGSSESQQSLIQAVIDGRIVNLNGLAVDDIRTCFDRVQSFGLQIDGLQTALEHAELKIKKGKTLASELRVRVNDALTSAVEGLSLAESNLDILDSFTVSGQANVLLAADGPVAAARDSLNLVKDSLKTIELVGFGQALQAGIAGSGTVLDTSQLKDMELYLKNAISELDYLLSRVDDVFNNQSSSIDFSTVFADAKTHLNSLQTVAASLQYYFELAAAAALDGPDNAFDRTADVLSLYATSLEELISALNGRINLDSERAYDWNDLTDGGRVQLDESAEAVLHALGALHGNPNPVCSGTTPGFECFAHNFSVLLDTPLTASTKDLRNKQKNAVAAAYGFLPFATAEDLRNIIINDTMHASQILTLNKLFEEELVQVADYLDELTGHLTIQINKLLKDTATVLDQDMKAKLASREIPIGNFAGGGIKGTAISGYARIRQDEISAFHLEGNFLNSSIPSSTSYDGALDITAMNPENGNVGCGDTANYTGLVDVTISTHDVPIDMLGTSASLKKAMLGFTLDGTTPIGIHGCLYTAGTIGFEPMVLYDIGLEMGAGLTENYFGAKCAGRFDAYQLQVAFFLGKTCGMAVMERLDPQFADLIGVRQSIKGVYVRGGVSIPIYDNGCFLRVGAGADVGAWYLDGSPASYGGVLGGSVYGTAICLGSVKGSLTLLGNKTGDLYQMAGIGWVAAGLGFCEPAQWNNVSDSRSDGWCITGDVTFKGKAQVKGYSDVDIDLDVPSLNCCY